MYRYRLGNRNVLETRNDQDEATVIIRNVHSGKSIEIPAFRWASFLLLQADIEEAVGKKKEKNRWIIFVISEEAGMSPFHRVSDTSTFDNSVATNRPKSNQQLKV